MNSRTVADVERPWEDPDFDSGLIKRCQQNWDVPVDQLTNHVLATFLRQQIAPSLIVPEARRRVHLDMEDDSELYDGELAEALLPYHDVAS